MIDPNKFLFHSSFGYGRVTKKGVEHISAGTTATGRILAEGLKPWTRWDIRVEHNGVVYDAARYNLVSTYNDNGKLKVTKSDVNADQKFHWVVYDD